MDANDLFSKAALLVTGLGLLGRAVYGFNSDGTTDIVWHNTATDQNRVRFMDQLRSFQNTLTIKGTGAIIPAGEHGWDIVATGDFNRDGQTDLFWRKPATGENAIWLMKGTNVAAFIPVFSGHTNYNVVGTGDFNGDGFPDLLWQHRILDETAIWLMNGVTPVNYVILPPMGESGARAVAVGDFNNDGQADILWQNASRKSLTIWHMNGTTLLSSATVNAYPSDSPSWKVAATGFFNPVGATDLVWRNTDGRNAVWCLRDAVFLKGVSLPAEPDLNWIIGGTGGYTNVMTLSARAADSPPNLRLSWRFGEPGLPSIQRRVFGSTTWTTLTNNYLPTRYTNTDLLLGQRYEYLVGTTNYLLAAINGTSEPLEIGHRGTVILVVDQTLAGAIGGELDQLRTNLVGDGWSVIRTNVPRHDDVTWSNNTNAINSIKTFLKQVYAADPAHTKAAFFVGHVPIPYAGCGSPDHHIARALPADGYYADLDGVYHDTSANCTAGHDETRHDNRPGDGKWDEVQIRGELKLAIGRVDFAKMPVLSLSGESDAQAERRLLRQYLTKDDRYRRKQLVVANRVVVGNFFDGGLADAVYPKLFAQALKNGSRVFGFSPESLVHGDCLSPGNPCLWGVLGGAGQPTQIQGTNFTVHSSADFAKAALEPRTAFVSLFGSYLLDYDYTNNMMRAFLGTPNYGLGAMWFSAFDFPNLPRHTLSFEQLGLGETVGSAVQRSLNNSESYTENIFVTWLGDPTLRWQVLAPPANLSGTSGANVLLTWSGSPEAEQYFVYRSPNGLDGPWTKLTGSALANTTYRDNGAPAGPKTYQVRAASLVYTGSGSYTNLSQGIFFTTAN